MTERTAPHHTDAEEALLGAMLLTRNAIAPAVAIVRAEHFYRPIHGHIFDAITNVYARGEGADPVTVAAELDKAGLIEAVGGPGALMSLQANTPATSNAGHYARIIRQDATFRSLIDIGGDISQLGFDANGDADETIDQAERLLHSLADDRRTWREVQHLGESLHDWIERIEARQERDTVEGVATGWKDLDGYLAGLRPGQLLTVAARPGMGKSAFAGALAIHASQAGHPVLFVSVEMSLAELQDRFLACITKVGLDPIRKGTVTPKDWDRIYAGFPPILNLPVYIEDNPNVTILGIRSSARRVAAKAGGLGLLIVDYIQLINGQSKVENRQVEVAEISRGLKKLALELQVPVVSLAQLNRNLEMRGSRTPQLSDLRESGAIENDSDVVMFLYRDEVYNPDTKDRGICDVVIAKQRKGPIGTVRLAYDTRTGRFDDLARSVA